MSRDGSSNRNLPLVYIGLSMSEILDGYPCSVEPWSEKMIPINHTWNTCTGCFEKVSTLLCSGEPSLAAVVLYMIKDVGSLYEVVIHVRYLGRPIINNPW